MKNINDDKYDLFLFHDIWEYDEDILDEDIEFVDHSLDDDTLDDDAAHLSNDISNEEQDLNNDCNNLPPEEDYTDPITSLLDDSEDESADGTHGQLILATYAFPYNEGIEEFVPDMLYGTAKAEDTFLMGPAMSNGKRMFMLSDAIVEVYAGSSNTVIISQTQVNNRERYRIDVTLDPAELQNIFNESAKPGFPLALRFEHVRNADGVFVGKVTARMAKNGSTVPIGDHVYLH